MSLTPAETRALEQRRLRLLMERQDAQREASRARVRLAQLEAALAEVAKHLRAQAGGARPPDAAHPWAVWMGPAHAQPVESE